MSVIEKLPACRSAANETNFPSNATSKAKTGEIFAALLQHHFIEAVAELFGQIQRFFIRTCQRMD